MIQYTIYLNTGASVAVRVEADNLDDAIDKAFDHTPYLCAQCAGWGKEYSLDLGDWEVDEGGHEVDGEFVDTSKRATR